MADGHRQSGLRMEKEGKGLISKGLHEQGNDPVHGQRSRANSCRQHAIGTRSILPNASITLMFLPTKQCVGAQPCRCLRWRRFQVFVNPLYRGDGAAREPADPIAYAWEIKGGCDGSQNRTISMTKRKFND